MVILFEEGLFFVRHAPSRHDDRKKEPILLMVGEYCWRVGVMAPGTSDGSGSSVGIRFQDMRVTGSAAAPRVAFPAERLAAARGVGIMTEYLRAGGGQRRGREAEG